MWPHFIVIQQYCYRVQTQCFAVSPFVVQAVRLESSWTDRVRYMVVIYTTGHQDTEENVVLGMDFTDKDR